MSIVCVFLEKNVHAGTVCYCEPLYTEDLPALWLFQNISPYLTPCVIFNTVTPNAIKRRGCCRPFHYIYFIPGVSVPMSIHRVA